MALSSLAMCRLRTVGECWLGCRLWEEYVLVRSSRGSARCGGMVKGDRVLGRQPALRSGQRAKYPRAMDFLLDAMML